MFNFNAAAANRARANRENAKKSTGPITPEGKAKSCLNRLSHGFASSTRFISDEDPEQFYALLNDLIQEHNPATTTEELLVEKMAHNHWIGLRAARLQGDVLNRVSSFHSIPHDLALFIRYQTTAERAFHRARIELVKARKEREKSANGFESQKAEPAPPPVAQKAPETAEIPEIPVPSPGPSEVQPVNQPAQPELIREMAASAEKISSAA